MAKNYTPFQSVPGIVAMPIALSIIAACAFGPKQVIDAWANGVEGLGHALARTPDFLSQISQLIR